MGFCRICGRESKLISSYLGVCVSCLRTRWEEAVPLVIEAHRRSRDSIGLPPTIPCNGVQCGICGNNCRVAEGGLGYCGIITNINGRLKPKTGSYDAVPGQAYYDPHPTNCVADWVCPGATGRGYPRYAIKPGVERGYYNIAVFYGSCNFNCLFCQNWEYRLMAAKGKPLLSVRDIVDMVSHRTTCICFFGGDPGPNAIHALKASREALGKAEEIGLRILRICWETNGLWNPNLLDKAVELSIETGGIVKIDIKAWSPEVYKALTGNDGRLVLKNVERVANKFDERPEVPLLVASTLLVPGYVDEYEVEGIAKFLAELNPEIPYRLLAFHPHYLFRDLPPTSRSHAYKAYEVAKKAGLKNVSIGNPWLLGSYY